MKNIFLDFIDHSCDWCGEETNPHDLIVFRDPDDGNYYQLCPECAEELKKAGRLNTDGNHY